MARKPRRDDDAENSHVGKIRMPRDKRLKGPDVGNTGSFANDRQRASKAGRKGGRVKRAL